MTSVQPWVNDPSDAVSAFSMIGGHISSTIHWASQHTGAPVSLVAAVALVVSWRIFKRSLRFAIQVAIALVVVLVATRFGWVHW